MNSGRQIAARWAFTLIEVLIVAAVLALLAALLLPALTRAKRRAQQMDCLSHLRRIAVAAHLYMDDNNGALLHHSQAWVLDDGTELDSLPSSLGAVAGGGRRNTQAEVPWVIFLQPYLGNRQVAFCPADFTPRSRILAKDINGYDGGITNLIQVPAPKSELAFAQAGHLTMESYLLNSVFTRKSARYALEGALHGFATETALGQMPNPIFIMFSERNSEALGAADNASFGRVTQDDYASWMGEGALVQWGNGNYPDQGWIRYNRHGKGANYCFTDGHVQSLSWGLARADQFPDHHVRFPLDRPPR
jgi:prepilin-type processing-associated H-X9-DG protein